MIHTITYSPAYTLVPTYECFNRCSYCNFRAEPGQSPWLTLADAREILEKLHASSSVCEILILSGEVHPRAPRRQAWFERIYQLCELALSLGFLPHTNAGPLSFEEMAQLKQVNVSMGLMLEQLTPTLLETVHRRAPSKVPQVRLQQLTWAGELKIPFTTGLLLGLGETEADRWETLEAIASSHRQWGHIQEVILQPHRLGSSQSFVGSSFDLQQLPQIVQRARQILPETITIQIPPNLVNTPDLLLDCLKAGATDLGGIVPKDEVNRDYHHLPLLDLKSVLASANYELVPRLPVYPQYLKWLSSSLKQATKRFKAKDSLKIS